MQNGNQSDPINALDRGFDGPAGVPSFDPSPRTFTEKLYDLWAEPRVRQGLRIGGIAAGATLAVGIITWNLLFAGMPKLPRGEDLWVLNREPAVQFVDQRGNTLAVRGNLYGPVVHSADLPAYVGQAFIAAEDQRFMEHGGVDMQSILRAVFANFSAGHTVQGGSTLTQQLVKNLLVGNEQTLRRKAQEARLATEMEATLSKQEILDLYLNRVYLGSNAYGVEAAAQAYFGKSANAISLAEAAFLGALPKAPSRYAGDRTGRETTARVRYVLDRMVASGFVTPAAAAAAKLEPLSFVEGTLQKPVSGYVLDEALKEARVLVPDLPPDAVIVLTVDGDLQRRAEAALNSSLSVRSLGASEGAIVVMDRAGGIRALVGGRDYKTSQFNRATQAKRQPGSAFKTFVYAAAIERGLEPTTVRDDAPIELAGWQPGNYEDNYRGPITLAQALAVSSNSVAAQIGSEVGPKNIAKLAKRFGIDSKLHAYPSIALGADEVTLLEMTKAYGVLANEGRRMQTHIVAEIRDQRGAVLYTTPEVAGVQVFDADDAAAMTGMLSNVVRFGTGVQAQIPGWQIAGKTGTSQSWRDAWFVGYSASMIGGVWIGNDDDRATRKVTGGGAAAALFAKVMTAAHRGLKPTPLRGAELAGSWLEAPFDNGFQDGAVENPELNPPPENTGLVALSDGELTANVVAPTPSPAETAVSVQPPPAKPVVPPAAAPVQAAPGAPLASEPVEPARVPTPLLPPRDNVEAELTSEPEQ